MGPVSSVLNRTDEWSHSDQMGAIKKNLLPRIANVLVAAPLEVVAVAQNIILVPVQAGRVVLKTGAKAFTHISNAALFRNLSEKMPAFKDFLKTIMRVMAYALGALCSATIGFISPKYNFKIQVALGLVTSKREEKAIAALIDEAQQKLKNIGEKLKEESRDSEATLISKPVQHIEIKVEAAVNRIEDEVDAKIEHLVVKEAENQTRQYATSLIDEIRAESEKQYNRTCGLCKRLTDSAYNLYSWSTSFFFEAQKINGDSK